MQEPASRKQKAFIILFWIAGFGFNLLSLILGVSPIITSFTSTFTGNLVNGIMSAISAGVFGVKIVTESIKTEHRRRELNNRITTIEGNHTLAAAHLRAEQLRPNHTGFRFSEILQYAYIFLLILVVISTIVGLTVNQPSASGIPTGILAGSVAALMIMGASSLGRFTVDTWLENKETKVDNLLLEGDAEHIQQQQSHIDRLEQDLRQEKNQNDSLKRTLTERQQTISDLTQIMESDLVDIPGDIHPLLEQHTANLAIWIRAGLTKKMLQNSTDFQPANIASSVITAYVDAQQLPVKEALKLSEPQRELFSQENVQRLAEQRVNIKNLLLLTKDEQNVSIISSLLEYEQVKNVLVKKYLFFDENLLKLEQHHLNALVPDDNVYTLLREGTLSSNAFFSLTAIKVDDINKINHDMIDNKERIVHVLTQIKLEDIINSEYFGLYLQALNSEQAVKAINNNSLSRILTITTPQALNDFLDSSIINQQSPSNQV